MVPLDLGFGASSPRVNMWALLDITVGLCFLFNLYLGFHVGYAIQNGTKRRNIM